MKRKIIATVLGIVVILSSLAGCGSDNDIKGTANKQEATADAVNKDSKEVGTSLEDASITVFIAASLSNVMDELKNNYQKEHRNIEIIFNPDSSGTLKTQIEEGASCDMFFSAAQDKMEELDKEGYVKSDTINNLLSNKVVLIKPKGGETKVTSFETITEAKNIALAGEDVPVGAYAREIFNNLGIWDKVSKMEINEGANVTAVLTAVSEGSNEVGIVYATDAMSVKDSVEVIAEAPETETPVIYPAALVKNPEDTEVKTAAAESFLEYICSDEAKSIFEKYGFTVNE